MECLESFISTYLEDGLLIFRERILTDELDDFGELIFSLEDLTQLLTESHELGLDAGVMLREGVVVVGERDVPVDGGEMLTLSELLVETPENGDDGEGGRGDGIGEITTGRRDGTDNGDGTITVGGAEAADVTGSLVELGKRGTEIGGETGIGGHLSETTGDFSQSLGPTRGGIGHHGDVLALITEVLSEGDTSVDGGLTSGDGHVGGVGDEAGTLHNVVHGTVDVDLEGGEVIEYLSHLVATLTASDVDNAIGVGVLGESLGNTGLSAAEGTWNSAGTALHGGEQGIEDALSGGQRVHWSELLGARSGGTHRPEMRHADVNSLAGGGLDGGDALANGVLTLGLNLNDSSVGLGRSHDDMLVEKIVLEDVTNLVTASDEGAGTHVGVGHERVEAVLVQGGQIDAARHEDGVGHLRNGLERALNSIENSLENTYSHEL